MYESPITKIYGEIHDEIIRKDEEHLMTVVTQNVGYRVDRDELIKALRYDRGQYRKGYLDCKIDMVDKVKKAKEEIDDLNRYFDNDLWTDNTDSMFKCSEVLEILDKLIESEG